MFGLGLEDAERQALEDALDDEYKAHTTYDQAIRDHGLVRPFVNIVDAEARHISALLSLFTKYNLSAPANRWLGKAPRFSSVHEACLASVQAEIDNVAIYDRALKTTRRPDILAVYHALRSASLDRHLPAFQRCVEHSTQGSA